MKSVKVFGNYVLVKPTKCCETVSAGGIVLTKEQTSLFRGEVIDVGRGDITIDGTVIAPECKVGDTVLFAKSGSHNVTVDNTSMVIIPASNIFARVQ